MANYTKQMQKIVQDYRTSGEPWPTSAKAIAEWAIMGGRWKMPAAAIVGVAQTTSPPLCARNTTQTRNGGASVCCIPRLY